MKTNPTKEKQKYVTATLTSHKIEMEEGIAAASVQPNNGSSEVKQEWNELGNETVEANW